MQGQRVLRPLLNQNSISFQFLFHLLSSSAVEYMFLLLVWFRPLVHLSSQLLFLSCACIELLFPASCVRGLLTLFHIQITLKNCKDKTLGVLLRIFPNSSLFFISWQLSLPFFLAPSILKPFSSPRL